MTKPKTQAQLDRAADLRLKKSYGRGLDWYEEQIGRQFFGCAICGDPPGTRRLHVDHDHKWKYVKIESEKFPHGRWSAHGTYNGLTYIGIGDKKSDALRNAREKIKSASVRGLLCHRCNRSLILLRDNPKLLRTAADYLESFQNPLTGQE